MQNESNEQWSCAWMTRNVGKQPVDRASSNLFCTAESYAINSDINILRDTRNALSL